MDKVLMVKDKWQVLKNCMANNKNNREVLKGLNVTAKHIEATDGRIAIRIHRDAMNTTVENGAYKIIAVNKHSKDFIELVLERNEEQFPDFNLVYPASYKDADGFNFDLMPEKVSSTSVSHAMIQIFKHTGNAVTCVLLNKLTSLGIGWKAYGLGQDKAVLLRDEPGTVEVLVVPFNVT